MRTDLKDTWKFQSLASKCFLCEYLLTLVCSNVRHTLWCNHLGNYKYLPCSLLIFFIRPYRIKHANNRTVNELLVDEELTEPFSVDR